MSENPSSLIAATMTRATDRETVAATALSAAPIIADGTPASIGGTSGDISLAVRGTDGCLRRRLSLAWRRRLGGPGRRGAWAVSGREGGSGLGFARQVGLLPSIVFGGASAGTPGPRDAIAPAR